MATYGGFARVYDQFMEDIPYEKWGNYIQAIFKKHQYNPCSIAELGCGTGNMTEVMAQRGYEMIGIDLSEEMLMMAKEKAIQRNTDILYILQDIREFELYGTVDCILSVCDTMNYILKEDELRQVFQLVNTYLNPGGLFIFDMNTEYKYEHILGSHIFSDAKENMAYIWENNYDEEEQINEYAVNFFIQQEDSVLYERFEEIHYQKAYSIQKVSTFLSEVGLELVATYDAFTFQPPSKDSERIYFIAKEIQKQGRM
ncbi:MAG: class I SAM-dependent methyltransferase [Epulopiscium sp.]|nr:class I SAM-dependent methyltransferase [Candidatus Epulonipiscium sp.]